MQLEKKKRRERECMRGRRGEESVRGKERGGECTGEGEGRRGREGGEAGKEERKQREHLTHTSQLPHNVVCSGDFSRET